MKKVKIAATQMTCSDDKSENIAKADKLVREAASKGAVEGGGEAIGVTVNLWSSRANNYLTQEIICETLFERIDKLIELGDGYVILQGGTGTLLELAAVWEYANKGLMENKPIVCHSKIWKVIVSEMNEQMNSNRREDGNSIEIRIGG